MTRPPKRGRQRVVGALLDRAGILAAVQRAREVLRAPTFGDRLHRHLGQRATPPEDLEAVRAEFLELLSRAGCDISPICLTFGWNPETSKLEVFVRPSIEAVARAIDQAGAA